MAKKAAPAKKLDSHEKNAKAVVSLLVLAIAFGVFFLFNTYQDTLLSSANFQMFVVLIVLLFGLLAGLLYLMSPARK